SIAADASGNVYVTGQTASGNFPTTAGVFKRTLSGPADAFVAKLNPNGTLAFSTYLGGSGDEYGFGIGTDSSSNIYVCGYTTSSNFPTVGPLQATLAGAHDFFVTKLNPTGTTLLYSTYLGGTGDDYPNNMTTDPAGNVYLAGDTTSTNMPLVSPL